MRRTARSITVALVMILAAAFVVRDRVRETFAADSETVTWGASDPTWSPDGSRLAFSLFGSIWTVASEGGEAQQLTSSAGYHAHPAWSPHGDRIAFLSGDPPAGPIPVVAGKLVVVDATGGAERAIETPQPAAGTPAWSPEGDEIACALRMPDGAALLHQITLATGAIRQLQQGPQASLPIPPIVVSSWADAAWPLRGNTIFFAAQRGPAPQIWSMAAAGQPNTIQMPLTHYRADQIVLLHGLSAMPDGSGAIYSANEINGKGDYDLYRIGHGGGAPVRLTETSRYEYSPSVSPDGRRVAFVSNQLGNIDLFTMPAGGGEPRHVRLAELKFRNASGRLRVRVVDDLGQPTRVRLYVRASDGKAYCPAGSPIFHYALEPGQPRQGFFVASGDDTFPLPAGPARIAALKGVEYDIADRSVDIAANETTEITIEMRRWTNWNQRGWYTGENHFHANYGGTYYQRPMQSLAWLEAEDLNAANMIVANNEGAFIHDKEFFRGGVDPLSTSRRILYWGQEYRNSFPLGHMAFLNIKTQVGPSFTSVPGSNSPYDVPLNTTAALAARKQGGFVSYVHPIQTQRDVFDTWLGAKESPVTAALGGMDSIDILPYGEGAYELWYRFLNCGFHIAAGAGTDVFTNWRGINNIPGGSREYVEVGSNLTWERWLARYREGRNFVTNGPLLTFSVNGEPIGAEIRIPAGQTYKAHLVAEVVARTPIESLELAQNGRIIESKQFSGGAREGRIEKEVLVESSAWFAARAHGAPARGIVGGIPRAHSSPIYVTVGGAPVLVRSDVELMIRWIDRLWALLEERDNFGPAPNRDRARRMVAAARQHFEGKLR